MLGTITRCLDFSNLPSTTSPAPQQPSAPDKHSDPKASESATPSSAVSHYATGPEPPPSYDPPTTHPDEHMTSDPIPAPHKTRVSSHEEEVDDDGGEGTKDDEKVESSSDDLSSSEGSLNGEEDMSGGEGEGQDRRLFPYRSSTRERQTYTYRKISELEAGMQKVNVFGVITDFQPPFQTKGRDICSIVNIIDESVSGNDSFKCTFFHSNQEKLPKVRRVGEIVSFHRLNIKMFPSGVQGVGQSFCSSLAYTGRLGAKVKPMTGSVSYTFTAQDKKRVKELRLWSAQQQKTNSPFARSLKDITVDAPSTDLVCQVLSISAKEHVAEEGPAAALCVWDGTRFPHRGLKLDLSTFNTTATDPELLQLAETFSECVMVYGRELVERAITLTPGQFVCLQNLQIKIHTQHNSFKDVFEAVELRIQTSHNSSRESIVKALPSSDLEVFELKKLLKKCQHRVPPFRLLPPDIVPSDITETLHSQQQPVPLSAVTKMTESPAKFRCTVKVLGIKPQSVEEIVQLRCANCKHKMAVTTSVRSDTACPKCIPNQRRRKTKTYFLQPVYFFQVTLADETRHIEAYVSGQQAAQFLTGFPPANFFQRPQQRISLLESLYRLTGGNDPFDEDAVVCHRPWVDICVVSMRDNGGNITYHLFDTILRSNAA